MKVMYSREQINERVKELGKEITEHYKGDLLVICVMRGAFMFTADLIREIDIENLDVQFIKVSSYENNKSTGTIVLDADLEISTKGKDVLIIEDIIDTGLTMDYLVNHLSNAKSIKVATLLHKKECNIHYKNIDFIGFEIPNKFVVGYGLDDNDLKRNLPYIGVME